MFGHLNFNSTRKICQTNLKLYSQNSQKVLFTPAQFIFVLKNDRQTEVGFSLPECGVVELTGSRSRGNIPLTASCIMLIHAGHCSRPVFQVTHSFEISNGVSMRLVVHSLSPQTFPGKVQRCAGTKTIINRGRAVVRPAGGTESGCWRTHHHHLSELTNRFTCEAVRSLFHKKY